MYDVWLILQWSGKVKIKQILQIFITWYTFKCFNIYVASSLIYNVFCAWFSIHQYIVLLFIINTCNSCRSEISLESFCKE